MNLPTRDPKERETQISQSKPSQYWPEKNKVKTNINYPTEDERIQSIFEDTDLNQQIGVPVKMEK